MDSWDRRTDLEAFGRADERAIQTQSGMAIHSRYRMTHSSDGIVTLLSNE
jgi:hypothetical protein